MMLNLCARGVYSQGMGFAKIIWIKDPATNKKFYEEEIAPYKGTLELWYCKNQSVIVDILLIIITISSVFVPSSKLHNYLFRNLPKHPIFNPS